MQEQIILESSKNINSFDVDNFVPVKMEQNCNRLPYTQVEETLNNQEIFLEERDKCNQYRLTFVVNPICSNILYNMRTEVVKDEGSSNCKALVFDNDKNDIPTNAVNSKTLDRKQAIRDTEYSHELLGDYKYHCGLDIFNNHNLRSADFIHVGMCSKNDTISRGVFNTLWDYKRDGNKNIVEEVLCEGTTTAKTKCHIYDLSNTYTFESAFNNKMKFRDGWYGFINESTMKIPNVTTDNNVISLNKIIAYNKPCEIYNMYPDKSLFSFNPKYNSFRNRLEYNWDYYLTYPYESDYSKFNTVMENNNNAIKTTSHYTWNYNEYKTYECFTSLIKHNLKEGDKVRFYYGSEGSTNLTKYPYFVYVKKVGDADGNNKDTCFMIDVDDAKGFKNSGKICFKKQVNDEECHYYIRRFKRLKNKQNEDYKSEIGKLFEENVYGDKMSQIIYTDIINLEGLTDNLGRDLSELYLTVVKTNRGYKKWYSNDNDRYTSEKVEFSHCFGKVTSGFDFGNKTSNFNIRKLHNIDNNYKKGELCNLWNAPSKLEDDITSSYDTFYGDIVEFCIDDYQETTLSEVYHRVNTAQREYWDVNFRTIFKDTLIQDDYYQVGSENFKIKEENIGDNYSTLQPEGYFYNPHKVIKIKEISEDIQYGDAYKLKYKNLLVNSNKVTFNTENDYEFLIGDLIAFYNYTTRSIIWGEIEDILEGGKLSVKTLETISTSASIDIILTDGTVPEYAVYKPIQQRFVWRNTMLPSEITPTSDIYDRTFTNGCLYINTNVNIYMRRQDPTNEFGLYDVVNFKDPKIYNSTHNYRFKGFGVIWNMLDYIDKFNNVCW